jgi:plasmid maintenance system antidote protein VapI
MARSDLMKEATLADAVMIARLLDVQRDTVWEIIKGMKYSTMSELEMAVHLAFQVQPLRVGTLQE